MLKIVEDIDAGNTNLNEEEANAITINQYGASLVAVNAKRGSRKYINTLWKHNNLKGVVVILHLFLCQ